MAKNLPKSVEGVPIEHLTAKQRVFIERYSIHRNATRAAEEAGYKHPNKIAVQLTGLASVASVIKQIEEKISQRNGLERDIVLKRLGQNLNRDLRVLVDEDGNFISDIRKIPPEAHAYIDGFKVKQLFDMEGNAIGQVIEIKLSPNASVQDMAMKHIGGYATEKHEHKMTLDWDSYLEPPQEISVEDEIEEQAKS